RRSPVTAGSLPNSGHRSSCSHPPGRRYNRPRRFLAEPSGFSQRLGAYHPGPQRPSDRAAPPTARSATQRPPRMKRFDIIDGMRGYFLVFMLINHLIFAGGYWLVKVNHNQLAFVEDAQGFVFLSGLLIGMVYARKMIKNGYAAGRQAIYSRAFELY